MRRNIIVIGEENWNAIENDNVNLFCFSDLKKVNFYSDKSGRLYVLLGDWKPVAGVIWRCQFFDNFTLEHKILDLIKYTNTRCINSASTNVHYGHNIAMFNAMQNCGMPVVPRRFMIGQISAMFVQPQHPVEVFKVGDYHRGYAKSIIRNKETYQDTIDMACCMADIFSLEPYVDYTRDVRILKIGNSLEFYEREPSMWKANVCPLSVQKIRMESIPAEIIEYSCKLAKSINADVIGVDWIMTKHDKWYALEANLAPGLETEDNHKKVLALL
jgi:ribosomal protein S6--L-glutamate ligase